MTPEPISHDQLVSRVQAFYSHLRKDYNGQRIARDFPCDDVVQRKCNEKEFHKASDLLDIFTHTFESVLYTWID